MFVASAQRRLATQAPNSHRPILKATLTKLLASCIRRRLASVALSRTILLVTGHTTR